MATTGQELKDTTKVRPTRKVIPTSAETQGIKNIKPKRRQMNLLENDSLILFCEDCGKILTRENYEKFDAVNACVAQMTKKKTKKVRKPKTTTSASYTRKSIY